MDQNTLYAQSRRRSRSLSQDPQDIVDNELPTYNELAAQQGPNSRFGRWKGWVEKRAAERYAEDTPEKRHARRLKGWGPHVVDQPSQSSAEDLLGSRSATLSRTQTVLSSFSPDGSEQLQVPTAPMRTSQALPPSHLKLYTFGSRFLPHSEHPILCLLPICDNTMLLIGHENGLSVLDMDPEMVSSELGPKEPRRRDIFHGEGIYQLELLEYEQSSTMTTPKGVVLALVGTDHPEGSDKESKEIHKAIRMYNLASLVSAARWASARKDQEALDLRHLSNQLQSQQPFTKKHKPRGSKTISNSGDINGPLYPQSSSTVPTSPPREFSDNTHSQNQRRSPRRTELDWDIDWRDDLPLRWSTDYVPLATSGSRLVSQSVLFFELHRSSECSRVTTRLAVATKQNILLYETVREERAFRFVKEFYTPIPARSATFLYQSQQGPGHSVRSPASATLSPHWASTSVDMTSRRASSPSPLASWFRVSPSSGQFSLFVVFDKKAGVIRISDSSVGEIELWEEPRNSRRASSHSPTSTTPFRLSIGSFDSLSIVKDTKGLWIPPAEVTLPSVWVIPPTFARATSTTTLYLLTRGKFTHILRSPLPMPVAMHAPLKVLHWDAQPTRIVPRTCQRPISGEPFLQVTALSEVGVEVQELPLSFIFLTEDRGEEQSAIVVQAEVGPGGAGFLCMGGHWTECERQSDKEVPLQCHSSTRTVDIVDLAEKRSREQGFYAWTQKGYNDWRVFWIGGSSDDGPPPASP